MKKTVLTVHEKAVQRIQRQADQHVSKFRQMELDVQEANGDLNEVVTAIDAEMDKLAALRIKTQKQIKANDTLLQTISGITGKGASQ
jgi:uncharacterized protein YoxC